METIWDNNFEARSLVYDYRMIFYIRDKKKKKISVRIFGLLSRNPTHPYIKTNSLYKTTKIAQLIPLNQTSSTSRVFIITIFSEAYDHSSLLTFKNFIDG